MMDIITTPLPAGLYLVSTPIGNLRDMTLRGLDTLAAADFIVCEDTRVSRKLLHHYGLSTRLMRYDDHTADHKRAEIIKMIQNGQAIALISDAGTPLISDPGYKLVRDCLDHDLYVTSLPGANAPLTALQLSGLPSDAFTFMGFLPAKSGARQSHLERWAATPGTLIAFETARRLQEALADIAQIYGGCDVTVVREISKRFEEIRRGTPHDLMAYYTAHGAPKGEIVLVISGHTRQSTDEWTPADIGALLKTALETMHTKEAAAHVAKITGKPRKDIYDLALRMPRYND
jgi:16S rRNA (cytidine1402-2'-O)-methyltransferase